MLSFNEKRADRRMHHDETAHGGPRTDMPEQGHAHGGRPHVHANTKAVLDRLSRAIGHLNGVRAMVEEGRDCSEVLIQLAAVRSALNGTCRVILQDHLEHCIVDAIETGDTETIEEMNRAIALLLR